MTQIAVIAHAGKTFGGGLPELRRELARQGVDDPLWIEVPKSRYVPKQVKRALPAGAELLFAWGGDGTVQRCIDTLAGADTPLAILPAGTANLFATEPRDPQDIEQAVAIGLRGDRHKLDVGRFEGEHFAVMAGVGFDASMIQTGRRIAQGPPRPRRVCLDGLTEPTGQTVQGEDQGGRRTVVDDAASCILVGNVGRLFGGVEVFEDASPDDGKLEIASSTPTAWSTGCAPSLAQR